ncbi:hypothetical protein [Neobacillus niacini]|uniref:hypothetical protein n=1 Tax=Neobacillus niacini TaxID=86668 RepID=UPI0005F08DDE|nr:hypothetical protein [Neobacillus niacini]
MNNELISLFRSVLKEELKPIHKSLDAIEKVGNEHTNCLDKIEKVTYEHTNRLEAIEQIGNEHAKRLNSIDQDVKKLKTGQERLEQEVIGHSKCFDGIEKDIKDLKTGQEVLQKNIIKSIGDNIEKIAEHFDNKTDALNKRVYEVETEIQRLIKQ